MVLFSVAASFPAFTLAQSPSGSGSARSFQPGVTIDWANRAVEVEARVVLREGPLELFACSPQTKEHESVLAVQARPLHIFQAMGLIGLQAGAPPSYSEKHDQWYRATGEPLDLRVRWRDGDKDRTVSPAAWMVEKKTGKAPEDLRWVFSGSVIRDQGGFAADEDGTVATVVDFDSALMSISIQHSADDAELWLAANPDKIPPRGTRCTLLIRSAYHPKVEVELDREGKIMLAGAVVTAEQVGRRLTENRDDRSPHLFVTYDWGQENNVKIRGAIQNLQAEMVHRNLHPEKQFTIIKEGDHPRNRIMMKPPLPP